MSDALRHLAVSIRNLKDDRAALETAHLRPQAAGTLVRVTYVNTGPLVANYWPATRAIR